MAWRDLAVLEVLYGAGLRVSECCGLRLEDVDLERGLVTVLGKRAKTRRVPLGSRRWRRSVATSRTAVTRSSPT